MFKTPRDRCWRRTLAVAFSISIASLWNRPAPAWAQTADDQLRSFIAAWWEESLRDNPLLATSSGDHRYDDRLPVVSLAESARQTARLGTLRQAMEQIRRDQLSAAEQTNWDLLRRALDFPWAEAQFGGHLVPITNREGFHVAFPELRRDMPFVTTTDYRNYLARLRAFPTYVNGHIELMREGIRRGWTLPSIVLSRYRDPIVAHLVDDPTKSLFYEPFLHFGSQVSSDDQAKLRQEAQAAIRDGVFAGYQAFLMFMQDEYVPAARGTIAAAALPEGRAFYQHRVRYFTTLDYSPEKVHEIGLSEVTRIESEMHEVMRRVDFRGSIAEFVTSLRNDPKLHAKDAEELLRITARLLKRIDGELPRFFRTLPRTSYGLQPIPEYIAPETTAAYYMPPPGDGSRSGTYFLNTYDLSSRPLYNLTPLSLHEAVPGHHLQIALQQELVDVPRFRRFVDVTSYIEGWALYAERLGIDMKLYEDPYDDFGRLTFEMWRACRLVVDTGIHYLGWSREQAIDFIAQRTALSLHDIRAEVDRYIAWPGQALAYKMGEITIRGLRQKAESALGAAFDLREFHDVILLQGPVTLQRLETQVDEWLAAKRSAKP